MNIYVLLILQDLNDTLNIRSRMEIIMKENGNLEFLKEKEFTFFQQVKNTEEIGRLVFMVSLSYPFQERIKARQRRILRGQWR